VTGLLGTNGAGKTTLLGMMLDVPPDEGSWPYSAWAGPAGAAVRERVSSPEHHLPADTTAQDLVRHIAEVHGLPTAKPPGGPAARLAGRTG
jgi:ABC-type multidrug transport system ATPase subunit